MPTLPSLPDWLPGWAAGLAVAIVALYLLLLLAMPFSVFGVKGRLEDIEGRLEEIEAALHELARRLPMAARAVNLEDAEEVQLPPPAPPVREAAGRAPSQRREPRLGPVRE